MPCMANLRAPMTNSVVCINTYACKGEDKPEILCLL